MGCGASRQTAIFSLKLLPLAFRKTLPLPPPTASETHTLIKTQKGQTLGLEQLGKTLQPCLLGAVTLPFQITVLTPRTGLSSLDLAVTYWRLWGEDRDAPARKAARGRFAAVARGVARREKRVSVRVRGRGHAPKPRARQSPACWKGPVGTCPPAVFAPRVHTPVHARTRLPQVPNLTGSPPRAKRPAPTQVFVCLRQQAEGVPGGRQASTVFEL